MLFKGGLKDYLSQPLKIILYKVISFNMAFVLWKCVEIQMPRIELEDYEVVVDRIVP